jgi:hypothetical protein
MAEFSRNRTNLTAGINSSPRVQKQTNIPHAVPEFVGAMRGIDPGAGDMTSAFSNFFGQINNAVQMTTDAYNAVEKQRITKENDTLKRMAYTDAQRVYRGTRGSSNSEQLAQMPTSVMVKNADGQMEPLDVSQRSSYTESFSHSLGLLNGERLIDQLQVERQRQNISPENYDAFAQNFWNQQFKDGTGNVYHDAAMYRHWEEKAGALKFLNDQDVVKRTHDKLNTVIQRSIYTRALNADGINHDGLVSSVTQYLESPAGKNKTMGEAKSAVISVWMDAAKKNKQTALALNRFLHEPHVDSDGVTTPSLMELFPQQMSVHSQNLSTAHRKHQTLLGSELVTKHTANLATANAMSERTSPERTAKLVALAHAMQTATSLDNTNGVPRQLAASHKIAVSAALQKLVTKNVNMNQAFRAMKDLSYRPKFTQAELDQTMTDVVEEMDYIKDPTKASDFGSGMAMWQKKYQSLPQPAIDMLKRGLTSRDAEVTKNTRKILKTLDPRGNMLKKHFADHPAALNAYDAAFTGSDQAPQPGVNNADQQAARELYSEDGSLLRYALGIDMSGIKKADLPSATNAELFGYTFGTGDNLAEMTVGKDAWFFEKDYRFSAEAERVALGIAKDVAINHYAANGEHITKDDLRKTVAARMKGLVVPGGNNLLALETAAAPRADDERPVERRANLVHEELNAEGRVENPLDTMERDIELVNQGLLNLTRDDGTKIEAGDLSINVNTVVPGTNLRYVMDNAHSHGRMPFQLDIGAEYRTYPTHDAAGEELGLFDIEAMRIKSLFATGSLSKNVEQKLKFTGDLAQDRVLAEKYLPPHFTLVPRKSGGQIVGYNLAIGPRHTNFSDDYISVKQLRARIHGGRPVPEGLKKHIGQRETFNTMETYRQLSEYGVYD